MKKTFLIFMAVIMTCSMFACGENSASEKEDTKSEENAVEEIVVDPKEEAKEKLQGAFDEYCDTINGVDFADLGYDRMSLTIDTKPNDTYYEYESEAISAIVSINSYLGLPSSLIDKFSSTRALDGMQTQNCVLTL